MRNRNGILLQDRIQLTHPNDSEHVQRNSDPLLIASPLPNESEAVERNSTNSPKQESKLEKNESVLELTTMRDRNEIPLQNQIQLIDLKEPELVHRNSEPLLFSLPISRELESAQRNSYP